MRSAMRSLVVVIGIAAAFLAQHADVQLMAATKSPGYSDIATMLPRPGAVVGVAHPVMVTFNNPVANRQAVQRAIEVKSEPPMTGRFEWLDTNVVQWVPDRFWPAHSTVALSV